MPRLNCSVFVGISMLAIIVVATTATSLSRIMELATKSRYLTMCTSRFCCLTKTFSCLFCFGEDWFEKHENDRTNNDENDVRTEDNPASRTSRSQFSSDAFTIEDNKDRVGENTKSSSDTSCLKIKPHERKIKFAIVLLIYFGYLGGAIYGMCKPDNWPDRNAYRDSDLKYPSFCNLYATAFDRDFILTLVVKTDRNLDWNLTNAALTSFIDVSIRENNFDPEYQINWLSHFIDNTGYGRATEPKSLSSFLNQNKLYQNDIVSDGTGGDFKITAFRIYLKTTDISKDQNVINLMRNLHSLENKAQFDCFFYDPEFLLYEGSIFWTDDLLRISVLAISVTVFILTVFFYHYHFHALLILFIMISIAVGVIGFTKLWISGLSFLSIIPMLLMLASCVNISVNNPFAICLFPGFLAITMYSSILQMAMSEFVLMSVCIPYFLYLTFVVIHRFLFLPHLILNWLKRDIYEAPRGVCAPLIPENNALISPDP